MDFFSTWILPPLVGAVIGYITNWLAIKMLFRPLAEVRLLGVRLPFTPGLLPRERRRMAQSIGDTVARELLTEEVLRRRFAEPDLRQALVEGVDGFLASALGARAADALPRGRLSASPLGALAARAWDSVVASEAFRGALAAALRRAVDEAEGLRLSSLVSPEQASGLASLLVSERTVAALGPRLRAALESRYEGGGAEGPGAASLPAGAFEAPLRLLVEGIYEAALPAVESMLREPELKIFMGRYANDIVRKAIGRLNLIQRLIVGAAQYERAISEGMPETIDDLIAAVMGLLGAPDTRRRVSGAAAKAFGVRGAGSGALAMLIPKRAALAALDAGLEALSANARSLAGGAAAFAAAKADTSLGSLLEAFGLPPEELAASVAGALSRSLAQGSGGPPAALASSLSAFLEALGGGFGEESLGEAIGVRPDSRRELAGYLADKGIELLSREAGRIVRGLDVRRIVVERIDELDMAQVERIVLDVAGKELTWITLLGGVLGGLIGILQSLVQVLGRASIP